MGKESFEILLEEVVEIISKLNRAERVELLSNYVDTEHFKKVLSIIYYLEVGGATIEKTESENKKLKNDIIIKDNYIKKLQIEIRDLKYNDKGDTCGY